MKKITFEPDTKLIRKDTDVKIIDNFRFFRIGIRQYFIILLYLLTLFSIILLILYMASVEKLIFQDFFKNNNINRNLGLMDILILNFEQT